MIKSYEIYADYPSSHTGAHAHGGLTDGLTDTMQLSADLHPLNVELWCARECSYRSKIWSQILELGNRVLFNLTQGVDENRNFLWTSPSAALWPLVIKRSVTS